MKGVRSVMTWLRRLISSGSSERRPRVVLACVVAVCVAVTGIAVTGASNVPPGLKFAQAGHWIYNSVLGTAFHIDGGSKSIDAEVSIPGLGPGTSVVQTDDKGYVLSREQTVEFGKSDLSVADPIESPAKEDPIPLEAAGAAFAIYPNAGKIVRMGEQPVAPPAVGRLGTPVVTRTGTLWVHQLDGGQLCQLPLRATRLSCTATTPTGHTGGLSLIGDQPVFVDTTANTMSTVSGDGLGRSMRLDVDVPGEAVVAANDLDGRLPILDPKGPAIHLVDAADAIRGEVVEPTKTAKLAPGRYGRIASSGSALVVIEEDTSTVVTLDERGEVRKTAKIPPPSKTLHGDDDVQDKPKPGLFRGEDDRLYVDSTSGEHVMVVEDDGEITPVEVNGDQGRDRGPSPTPTQTPTPTPTPTQTPTQTPTPKNTPEREREPRQEPEQPRTSDPVPASRPGVPVGVKGTAGDARITVTWKAAPPNGARVTSYQLTWSGGSKTVSGGVRSTTITGLRNGSGYEITVRAVNRVGPGPGVSTARLYPGGSADAPTSFRVEAISEDEHRFSWKQPDLNGGKLVEYRLIRDNGANTKTPTATSQTWGGLIDGKQYHFTVQAITTSPTGRTLVGKQAALTFTVDYSEAGFGPRITARKGPSTSYGDKCVEEDGCSYVEFNAEGLQPNTEYTFTVYASEWGEFNSVTLTTDENGAQFADDRFACDPDGQDVWIVAEGPGGPIESNHFAWGD